MGGLIAKTSDAGRRGLATGRPEGDGRDGYHNDGNNNPRDEHDGDLPPEALQIYRKSLQLFAPP